MIVDISLRLMSNLLVSSSALRLILSFRINVFAHSVSCRSFLVYVLCMNLYCLDFLHYKCIMIIFYNLNCNHLHLGYFHHRIEVRIFFHLHRFQYMIWKVRNNYIKVYIADNHSNFYNLSIHQSREDTFANKLQNRFQLHIEIYEWIID